MIRFEEKEKFRFGWNVKINMQQSFCDSNGGYTLSSGLKAYVKEYLLEHYYALDYDEEGYDDYEEEFYS
jgi:hypothetical protein